VQGTQITDEVKRRDGNNYHEAMLLCPGARAYELRRPLQLAAPQDGEVIVDFPSGGSYLGDYLRELAGGAILQPVEHVSAYLEGDRTILKGSWDRLPFGDHEVNVVVTLAALHHVMTGRVAFYRECHRVLAPQGRLILGDVEEGTSAGLFLDQFVDRYSSQGHEARFLVRDVEVAKIEEAGFKVVEYEVTPFYWSYPDRETAIQFCRRLFRLDLANNEQIWQGLSDYLGIYEGGREVRMNWQLAFVRADWQDA